MKKKTVGTKIAFSSRYYPRAAIFQLCDQLPDCVGDPQEGEEDVVLQIKSGNSADVGAILNKAFALSRDARNKSRPNT